MNRRDIIIVAALINAGLLIVLFVTGLKSDDASTEMASVSSSPVENVFPVEMASQPMYITPMDSSTQAPAVTMPTSDAAVSLSAPVEVHSFAASPSVSSGTEAVSMNFADDLKAFSTSPETSSSNEFSALASTQNVSETKQSHHVEVTVKKGDVLEKIARQHKTTVDAILKANNLSSAKLKIGQVLKVPAGQKSSSSTGSAVAKSSSSSSAEAKYYTVKNGDNPWTIAVKNRMKVEDLLKLNNLNEEKARKLKPGDKLRIQ